MNEVIYISSLSDFYEKKGAGYRIKENGSNINKEIRQEMIGRLMEFKKRNDMTVIAVTHNDDFDCYGARVYTL